ncbi:MAG TPA: L-threonylcarbamoyladenylate synthase [Puia sp.]|nr:L-threonylcarbamoyladenylate synthase [Puia sp.]
MEFDKDVEGALAALRAGGLILYPTDTIWGIGCDATDETAVAKVYALKQREAAKSLIVLVANERDLLQYTSQPDPRVFDYLRTVQKPTTVIYEGAIGLASNLVNADGTVAIRVAADQFCRHLIKRFRKPIVSTSANLSGDPAPAFFADIDPRIVRGVDYVAEHRRDDRTAREPSAIIKWNPGGAPTVIRS